MQGDTKLFTNARLEQGDARPTGGLGRKDRAEAVTANTQPYRKCVSTQQLNHKDIVIRHDKVRKELFQ